MVRVETAGRWRAREARRRAAAAQAAPAPDATVFVAGGRGADRALQGRGAARGQAGAAVVVVVWGARQAADAHPGAIILGRGAVVQGGAPGAVHQLGEARQEV